MLGFFCEFFGSQGSQPKRFGSCGDVLPDGQVQSPMGGIGNSLLDAAEPSADDRFGIAAIGKRWAVRATGLWAAGAAVLACLFALLAWGNPISDPAHLMLLTILSAIAGGLIGAAAVIGRARDALEFGCFYRGELDRKSKITSELEQDVLTSRRSSNEARDLRLQSGEEPTTLAGVDGRRRKRSGASTAGSKKGRK